MVSTSAQPALPKLEECWFYHVMDLPGLGTIEHPGSWDLRGRFDEYIAHTPISGKTLVDVGTASGFLSFEAEKRGAIVTSLPPATRSISVPAPMPEESAPKSSSCITATVSPTVSWAHGRAPSTGTPLNYRGTSIRMTLS